MHQVRSYKNVSKNDNELTRTKNDLNTFFFYTILMWWDIFKKNSFKRNNCEAIMYIVTVEVFAETKTRIRADKSAGGSETCWDVIIMQLFATL